MSEEAGFQKAIADDPAERATRLAYADWLEENGRTREAEFLKLQLQIAEANARLLEMQGELAVPWLSTVGNVRGAQEITLPSGRTIRLQNLRQWNFNAGWFDEHALTSEDNRSSVQQLVAEEELRREELPYLIQPTERPFKPPGLSGRALGLRLPEIACVGEFDSFPALHDKSFCSQLTIIWFQHEFAFPIDPGVREQIRAIDWDQHAHDFDH